MGRIALSLRRVNVKEKKAVLQEHKQKIALKVALKQILKEDYEKVTSKILKDYKEIIEFIEAAKEDHLLVEKITFQRILKKKF